MSTIVELYILKKKYLERLARCKMFLNSDFSGTESYTKGIYIIFFLVYNV